ncbi:hypothetical protein ACLK17_01120 [Escherichia coli]
MAMEDLYRAGTHGSPLSGYCHEVIRFGLEQVLTQSSWQPPQPQLLTCQITPFTR